MQVVDDDYPALDLRCLLNQMDIFKRIFKQIMFSHL